MIIIILMTVVGSSALMLWLAYSYKRRQSKLRTVVRLQSGFTPNIPQPNALLPLPHSVRWSFIDEWHVQAQHDDRPLMIGFVELRSEAAPSVQRPFARQRHRLMYKKWCRTGTTKLSVKEEAQ
jgi:hypothetical protein